MARIESKAIMGYLPIETKHHAAITSLVAPATPAHKLLDPYAGEGEFLEVAANRTIRDAGAQDTRHGRSGCAGR